MNGIENFGKESLSLSEFKPDDERKLLKMKKKIFLPKKFPLIRIYFNKNGKYK